jgi:hypothetical protein
LRTAGSRHERTLTGPVRAGSLPHRSSAQIPKWRGRLDKNSSKSFS